MRFFGWLFGDKRDARQAGGTRKKALAFAELRELIHKRLVDRLSQSKEVSRLSGDTLRLEVRLVVERLVDVEDPLLNRMEREQLINEVLTVTLGPHPDPAWPFGVPERRA